LTNEEENWIGIRLDSWKYTISSRGKIELYNLQDDPQELLDLFGMLQQENKRIEKVRREYIRIVKEEKVFPFFMRAEHMRNLQRIYICLKDYDEWGYGSGGSPTNLSIQINEGKRIKQNPENEKLLDSPRYNRIELDSKDFLPGLNKIRLRNELSAFELELENGQIKGFFEIEDNENKKVTLKISDLSDQTISPEKESKIREILIKIPKRMIDLLKRYEQRKSYQRNKEDLDALKTLGYIK